MHGWCQLMGDPWLGSDGSGISTVYKSHTNAVSGWRICMPCSYDIDDQMAKISCTTKAIFGPILK